MSQVLIQQYLAKLRMVSGSTRESVVREVFKDLLTRVTTVSVETQAIVEAMRAVPRERP
ncbi:MAG: hypothetical protein IT518_23035 [Burkholderiales bacterium]|nr:hypothetical protein [Burkholderiales bacterium]